MNTKNQLANQGLAALIILLLCSIAIMLFGCAENPAAPSAFNNSSEKTFVDIPDSDDVDEDDGINPFAAETVFVAADTTYFLAGPDGATSRIFIQGKKVDFLVNPNALDDTVTIAIIGMRYRIGRTTDLYIYECGPEGLQFNIPLELTQLIDRPDGSIATLSYYDDSVDDGDGIGWETVAPSIVSDGKGVFFLHHFSKYGISYVSGDPNTEIGNETHCD